MGNILVKRSPKDAKKLKPVTLSDAIRASDIGLIKKLLRAKANVHEGDCYGPSPIDIAAQLDSPHVQEILTLLLKARATLETETLRASSLMLAVRLGRKSTVEFLLAKKADCEERDETGTTPLNTAVSEGDEEIVTILLRAKATISTDDLNRAIQSGNANVVKTLLEKKASPQLRRPILSYMEDAARSGHTEMVKVLLDAEVDLEDRSILGELKAETSGELIDLLITANADFEVRNSVFRRVYGQEPPAMLFIKACRAGNYKAAQVLLKAGANINARDSSGLTALDATNAGKNLSAILELFPMEQRPAMDKDAWYKRMRNIIVHSGERGAGHAISQISSLLAAGVLIDYAPPGEASLLEFAKASASGPYGDVHQTIINLLIEASEALKRKKRISLLAGLHLPGKARQEEKVSSPLRVTAPLPPKKEAKESPVSDSLFQAVIADPLDIATVKRLIDSGADVNERVPLYTSLARVASRVDGAPAMQLLLAAGADWRRGNPSRTPFYLAVKYGRVEAVKILLDAKANPNGKEGVNPLKEAIDNNDIAMIRLLLANKASVEGPLVNGESPLIYATEHNVPEVVNMLVEAKASLEPRGLSRNTALHAAVLQFGRETYNPLLFSQLIDAKVDPNAVNADNKTALYLALQQEGRLTVLSDLIAAKAPPSFVPPGGQSILHYAKTCCHQRVVDVLEKFGKPLQRSPDLDAPAALRPKPDKKSGPQVASDPVADKNTNVLAYLQSRSTIFDYRVLRVAVGLAGFGKAKKPESTPAPDSGPSPS